MSSRLHLVLGACVALVSASVGAADIPVNWTKHCGSCHGKDGKGQTAAGRKIGAKDLTDPKVQAEFTDDVAVKAIKEGITRDGKEKMKPLGNKLNDAEIKELVAFTRTLKK